MAFFNKIGLLVLNEDATKFLVCEKDKGDVTADFIMPGGQFHEASVEACLQAEIKEELDCDVDISSLQFVGEYVDVAAGMPDKDVSIKLYQGRVTGQPVPSSEIKHLHWIGKADYDNPRVSAIIRNKIIPDLVAKGIIS